MSLDETKILKKDNFEGFLKGLLKDNYVFGPSRKGGQLLFDRIESPQDIVLGHGNTMNSAKDVLFPQTEKLFAYRHGETGVEIDRPAAPEKASYSSASAPVTHGDLSSSTKCLGGLCRTRIMRKRGGRLW
jgi:hypothetical protein